MGEPYILKYNSKIIKLFKKGDLKFGFDVEEKKKSLQNLEDSYGAK